MRELQVLGNGHLRLDFADWKEFFESEMAEQLRSQLKALIEQALIAERDYYLQLNYHEHAPRCRLDYRNGYYFRDFLTQLGRLAGVRIPRTRKGFRSQVLPRYQRRQAAVNQLIREAFLRGISTRQVSDVLQPVLGETYSAQAISNITRQLDTARPAVSPRPAARRVSLSFPRRHRAQSARQCA
jgi:putative transposase